MKTIITIDSNALLELQTFTSKDKTRPQLQGIAFSAGMAYATDSYRGISHPYTCDHEGVLVLDFKPILPLLKNKKPYNIEVLQDGENYFVKNASGALLPIKESEGNYPPIEAFEGIIEKPQGNTYELGIDTSLLPKGRFILKLDPQDPLAPISITTLDKSDYRIVIMPLRTRSND